MLGGDDNDDESDGKGGGDFMGEKEEEVVDEERWFGSVVGMHAEEVFEVLGEVVGGL